ncbi:MAG: hypothetical protein ACJ72N_02235 [Labedaea sp.]
MKNTITQQQASERAERYIREAVAGLIPPARLEVLSSFDDSPCDDPTDNGPKGRVIASRGYWLNDISPDQHSAYVDDLVRWWSEHNFTVLTDNRPGNVYVWAENRNDGFRMAIQQTEIGPKRLSLGATSPCVWPNGTPEPQSP